ncbi:MAG: DUF3493 domain-containing protein [Lyngbya sp. HA4199-MV5]|jgi:hypothetical protein|nr:DUF3493 domain-containing protein [Lyngbya sp. HA4199-MV5]
MADKPLGRTGDRPTLQQTDPEKYAFLKAEAEAPYRGLRKFVYVSFAASGAIGAFIFLAKLAAGQEVSDTLPNLALQIGVVALMIWLFRLDSKAGRKSDS